MPLPGGDTPSKPFHKGLQPLDTSRTASVYGTGTSYRRSVEFLLGNNNHDCLSCLHQVMENRLALDPLDLMPVFSCFQFLFASPLEY